MKANNLLNAAEEAKTNKHEKEEDDWNWPDFRSKKVKKEEGTDKLIDPHAALIKSFRFKHNGH